jgi:hypothetical protein
MAAAEEQQQQPWRSIEDMPSGSVVRMEGHEVCFRSAADLLEAMGLPGGLLPLEDVLDCGFDKASGSIWIRQRRKSQHFFSRIGRMVSFDTEIRACIAHRRLHSVSGVRARELLLWAPISDVSAHGDDKVQFRSYGGLTRTFPSHAFSRGE